MTEEEGQHLTAMPATITDTQYPWNSASKLNPIDKLIPWLYKR